MKLARAFILLVVLIVLLTPLAWSQDGRYCGPPARDADGVILRSRAVLRDFQHLYPCPSTGLQHGACPGWQINHVIPLAACGCDAVENLQWLPAVMKSGPGALPVDRWERRIYKCRGGFIEITPMPSKSAFRLGVMKR